MIKVLLYIALFIVFSITSYGAFLENNFCQEITNSQIKTKTSVVQTEPKIQNFKKPNDTIRPSKVSQNDNKKLINFNSDIKSNIVSSSSNQRAPAPVWCWAEDALASGNEAFLDLCTNPASGESYAVGYFNGNISAEFPMGINNTPDMSFTIGGQDGLVVKYDAQGNVIWAFKIGYLGNVWITGVEIGAGGNIFITGYFNNRCEFTGTTTSSSSGILIASNSNDDAFLASYDSDGNFLWVKQGSCTGIGNANDIAVNGNNVYVIGNFQGSITWTGTTPQVSNNGYDVYAVGYSQTGAFLWKTHAGDIVSSSGNALGYAIAADNNSVYLTGTHDGTIQINGGPIQVIAPVLGTSNIFLTEINSSSGVATWADGIGGTNACIAKGLAVDASNLYVCGGIEGSISFPSFGPAILVPGTGKELFVSAINLSTKITQWVEIMDNNTATDRVAENVIADGMGNAYVLGPLLGITEFNNSSVPITASGSGDCFVMGIEDNGTYLWTQTAYDNNPVNGRGIGYDNLGGIYIAGSMFSQATFGSLPILGNASGDDAFIAKIFCTTPVCGPTITTCQPNTTVIAGPACTTVLANYTTGVIATDNCGTGLTITQSPLPGSILNAGTHTILMTVTDDGLNTDTCSFLLTIEANVNPTIVNCGDNFINQTTLGEGNKGNLFSCSPITTPGEDVYYQVDVPSGNYILQIEMSNVSDVNDGEVSVFWLGTTCPLGGSCIYNDSFNIATQTFANGSNKLTYSAPGPGTYYFVVDSPTDHIDQYSISFNCLSSGIEFDESGCDVNDVDLNGVVTLVNSTTSLDVIPCQNVIVCNELFIANPNDFEWMDSVRLNLGSCYTNVSGFTPDNPPINNGFYDSNGEWDAVYNLPSNSITWEFDHSSVNPWGDGTSGNYSCHKYTFCFSSTISSSCNTNSDLNISIAVGDDGIPSSGSGNSIPGFDAVLIDDLTINNPPPSITCSSSITQPVSAGNCNQIVNGINPFVTSDNCSGFTVSYTLTGATTGSGSNDASGTVFNAGISTVNYIITDIQGVSSTCSFTVTITDNILPTITCPAQQAGTVNASCQFALLNYTGLATANDNCGNASITQSPIAGTNVGVGTTVITLTATDVNGNSSTCNFNVVVTDVTVPTITCPASQSGNVNSSCQFSLLNYTGLATATDNCGVASVTQSPIAGTNVGVGTTVITLTVTDVNGNSSTCNFNVVVTDVTAPTITCPTPQSGTLNASCQFALLNYTGLATLNDNCGIASITQSPIAGTNVGVGTTVITLTVTDVNGNSSTCNFNVVVTDNILPTITCPANQIELANAACQGLLGNYTSLVITNDNCGIANITQSPVAGTLFTGLQSVTIIVEDFNGNLDSCSFDVTVIDVTPPTFSCPPNLSQNTETGFCSAVVIGIDPILLSDNCSVPTLTYTLTGATTSSGTMSASGETFNLGLTTVTYTATDAVGNMSTCNFDVTIVDGEKPVISCTADIFSCDSIVTWIAPNANDNCGIASITQITGLPSGSDFPVGTNLIQFVAIDNSNNIDTCTFQVTIYPPSDASWIAPPTVCESDNLVDLSLLVTGNNGGFFIGLGITSPHFDPSVGAGIYSLTYIAGVSGCEDTASHQINVLSTPRANAGLDSEICELDYILSGTATNGIGTWSGNGLSFAPNSNDSTATVTSSNYGAQTIYWTVDQSGICSVIDSVEITFYETPIANAGIDQDLNFLFSTNLAAVSLSSGVGIWSGDNGNIFDVNDQSSWVEQLINGNNIFYWTVTNGPCPVAVDDVNIFVNDIFIPQAVTPNGDNQNDYFIINGIIFTDYNKLEIFNRWGQLEFEVENYQNDWNGKDNNGKELPADTYFYILNINDKITYNGYVVLIK
jgi:gliding motility-associated-like protein